MIRLGAALGIAGLLLCGAAQAELCLGSGVALRGEEQPGDGPRRFRGGFEATSDFVSIHGDAAVLRREGSCVVLEVRGEPARFRYQTETRDEIHGEGSKLLFPAGWVVLRGDARLSSHEGEQQAEQLALELPPPFDGEAHLQGLTVSATQGDADAQWELAKALASGEFGTRDMELARYWLEAAARSGHEEAEAELGALDEAELDASDEAE